MMGPNLVFANRLLELSFAMTLMEGGDSPAAEEAGNTVINTAFDMVGLMEHCQEPAEDQWAEQVDKVMAGQATPAQAAATVLTFVLCLDRVVYN